MSYLAEAIKEKGNQLSLWRLFPEQRHLIKVVSKAEIQSHFPFKTLCPYIGKFMSKMCHFVIYLLRRGIILYA